MIQEKQFSQTEALMIGNAIGIDWRQVDLEQFRMGLAVELEHGARDPQTNVTSDDLIATGKIALAHLKELPDYYTRLAIMESGSGAVAMGGAYPPPTPGPVRPVAVHEDLYGNTPSPYPPPFCQQAEALLNLNTTASSFWTGAVVGVGVALLTNWAMAKK